MQKLIRVYLLLIILMQFPLFAFGIVAPKASTDDCAQITLQSEKIIEAIIVKITETEVLYKLCNSPNKKTFTLQITDVWNIKSSKGQLILKNPKRPTVDCAKITLQNEEIIEGVIVKTTKTEILYIPCDAPNRPPISLAMSDIWKIKSSKGQSILKNPKRPDAECAKITLQNEEIIQGIVVKTTETEVLYTPCDDPDQTPIRLTITEIWNIKSSKGQLILKNPKQVDYKALEEKVNVNEKPTKINKREINVFTAMGFVALVLTLVFSVGFYFGDILSVASPLLSIVFTVIGLQQIKKMPGRYTRMSRNIGLVTALSWGAVAFIVLIGLLALYFQI